jgi:hypothetical protein
LFLQHATALDAEAALLDLQVSRNEATSRLASHRPAEAAQLTAYRLRPRWHRARAGREKRAMTWTRVAASSSVALSFRTAIGLEAKHR